MDRVDYRVLMNARSIICQAAEFEMQRHDSYRNKRQAHLCAFTPGHLFLSEYPQNNKLSPKEVLEYLKKVAPNLVSLNISEGDFITAIKHLKRSVKGEAGYVKTEFKVFDTQNSGIYFLPGCELSPGALSVMRLVYDVAAAALQDLGRRFAYFAHYAGERASTK